MINSRLRSIIRKEFIQILRDPRTLVLVLVIPIMQLFLLGYAATNDIREVPLAVFDQDRGPAARELLNAYRNSDYFLVAFDVQTEQELSDLIDGGEARVGLIIPPDYTDQLRSGDVGQVVFIFDGTDPTVASTALSSAKLIGQSLSTQIITERLSSRSQAAGMTAPVDVRTQVWYNPDLLSTYYMIPGVIGMILFALTSILTATAIVRERERGTIEQLIVTPIRSWELVVGKMLPYVILALLNTLEVLALGHYWFKVPVRSDLWIIMVLSALFLLSSLGIGLLASTFANTQQEAMLLVWMTLLPAIFLSGFFFPIQSMPQILQFVSYFLPLRYYLTIIRSLMLKENGLIGLQDEIIALIIFGFAFLTIASLRFKKRLD